MPVEVHVVRFRNLRRTIVLAAVSALGLTGVSVAAIAGSPAAGAATTGCQVAYSVQSQWSTGFSVSISSWAWPVRCW